jgi:hypothetical protein
VLWWAPVWAFSSVLSPRIVNGALPVIPFLLAGGAASVLIYLAACARCRKPPDVIACIEAILLGAGVPNGVHLMYCAFVPASIAEITYADGRHFDLAEHQLVVRLGEYHAIEVFIGGFVGAFFCIAGLVSICKRPYRAAQAESRSTGH